MKSRRYSINWMIFATAVIFFIFGKFIAPRYEELLLQSGVVEKVTPISKYSLIACGVLVACLIVRFVFQWKNRKKK